jgi:hypothetical protein
VINWTLEVEDVEDVACAVDDMEATDQRGCSEGMVEQDSGSELMGVIDSDGARLRIREYDACRASLSPVP